LQERKNLQDQHLKTTPIRKERYFSWRVVGFGFLVGRVGDLSVGGKEDFPRWSWSVYGKKEDLWVARGNPGVGKGRKIGLHEGMTAHRQRGPKNSGGGLQGREKKKTWSPQGGMGTKESLGTLKGNFERERSRLERFLSMKNLF